MAKECSVVLNNEAVTVVRFDKKDIQFPSINKDVKKVSVNYENGKYSIVDDVAAKSANEPKKKNSTVKKTTLEETVVDTENEATIDNK